MNASGFDYCEGDTLIDITQWPVYGLQAVDVKPSAQLGLPGTTTEKVLRSEVQVSETPTEKTQNMCQVNLGTAELNPCKCSDTPPSSIFLKVLQRLSSTTGKPGGRCITT